MQQLATVIVPVVLIALPQFACVWIALGKAAFADRLMGFVLLVCLLPGVVGGLIGWMGLWLAFHLALLVLVLLVWRHVVYEPPRFSLAALMLIVLILGCLLFVGRQTSHNIPENETLWTGMLLQLSLLSSLLTWLAVWTALSFKRRAALLTLLSVGLAVFVAVQTWPVVEATPKWKYPVQRLGYGTEVVFLVIGYALLIAFLTRFTLRGKLVVHWVLEDQPGR